MGWILFLTAILLLLEDRKAFLKIISKKYTIQMYQQNEINLIYVLVILGSENNLLMTKHEK